jgi:ketosteroid isomerase-like protein
VTTSTASTLVQYYAHIDDGDLDAGLALMAPDVRFAISLPGSTHRGDDRDGVRAYLDGRGPARRRHVPLRVSVLDDVEFVYGAVTEDDTITTGHFLASVHLGQDGRIAAYQVAFDPDLQLLPARTEATA